MKFSIISWIVLILLMIFSVFRVAPAEMSRTEVVNLLAERMAQGYNTRVTASIDSVLFSADPQIVLEELVPYQNDSSSGVRGRAYGLVWKIGIESSMPQVRRKAVEQLTKAYTDLEKINVGWVGGRLLSFIAADFTENSKATLRTLLAEDHPTRGIILACGVADMQDQIPRLESLASTLHEIERSSYDRLFDEVGWDACLALARMGSSEYIAYCIDQVESLSDPEERIDLLYSDITYIRQPATIDLFQQYLESDEGIPMKVDRKCAILGIKFSDVGLRLLEKSLVDFPFKMDELIFEIHSESEFNAVIDSARQWMSQGEFQIKR